MTEMHVAQNAPGQAGTMSPGTQLRAARERAGWTAERLAAELCLPAERLRALEEDDHAGFGGVVYVRGYLRRAAVLLGLPQEELIKAFEACCDIRRPAEILPGPIVGRLPRRGAPGWLGPAAGVTVVIAAAVGSWWMMGEGEEGLTVANGTAGSSAGLEFTTPQQAEVAPPPQIAIAENPPTTESSATAADEPVAQADAEAAPVRPVPEAVDQMPRVVQAPEPPPPPPGTAELRFEFSEDCWLEVTDADEARLAYRLYRAGDVARLRGKAPMMVFLGNAEGVRLTVNGAPIAVRPAARRDGTARLTVGGGAG